MNTKKNTIKSKGESNQTENKIDTIFSVMSGGEYKELPIYKIEYSPFNYRKLFSEKDLNDFASDLLQHGIISPLTVRTKGSEGYELVTGERRLRAATIAGIAIEFTTAFLEHAPDALIFNGYPSEEITALIQSVKGACDLPTHSHYDIEVLYPPDMPVTEDYIDEQENDGEEESVFDEKRFNEAMEEYEEEMEQYKMLMQSGKLQKGLLVMENNIGLLAFSIEKQTTQNKTQTSTAKEVDAAIKTGTATVSLLEAEIERLNNKEARSKQLDREKIQLVVHEKFSSQIEPVINNTSLTTADEVAARLLIYQSMNYYTRSKVNAALFSSTEDNEQKDHSKLFYEKLAALTESQYSYLIRNAIACQADSKFPSNVTGYFLYKEAESAGLNIESIELVQEQKAAQREKKQSEKIKELEKQISKLKKKAA